jgi:hypothetical protein
LSSGFVRQMQAAITRSIVELGAGAVKVLRCSSLRSDPADAGPADLDGACAQLRFGHLRDGPLPCRRLSLTTVSSGAILHSSRRCHTTLLRIARRACGARCSRRSQSPNRTPRPTHRAVRYSTAGSDIQPAHRPVRSDASSQRPRVPDRTESSAVVATGPVERLVNPGGQGHEPGHRRAEHGSLRFDVGGTPASARLTQHVGHIGRRAKRAHPRTRNRPVLNMRGEPWNMRTRKTCCRTRT